MIATVSLDSLLSGLIGVFVGSVLSWIIAWWIAMTNDRDALRGKLLALKSYHLFEIGDNKSQHFQKFRATYPDILTTVLAYRNLLPPNFRWKIDEALYCYRGDKNGELKNNPLFLKYSHIDVASEFDFEQRIDKLLEAIETIN
jgi:hypothetical protein